MAKKGSCHSLLFEQYVGTDVQCQALPCMAQLGGKVRDWNPSGDLDACVAVPQVVRRVERDARGLHARRMMFLIVGGVAPGVTRRSGVRSSPG